MDSGDRLSHAYLVAAPQEEGMARALKIAQALVCSGPENARPCGVCRDCRKALAGIHPDILILRRRTDDRGKPRREIYVEQIRDIVADAAVLPNEAERKVYLIAEAGAMNPAAQNALLKLLEEPPRFVALILVAEHTGQLLETVRSRCVTVHLNGEGEAPSAEARTLAERWLDIAAARSRISLITLSNELGERSASELTDFVRAAKGLLTDALCGRIPARKIPRAELLRLVGVMDRAEEYLRFNVSVKQLLGMLLANTFPKEQERRN